MGAIVKRWQKIEAIEIEGVRGRRFVWVIRVDSPEHPEGRVVAAYNTLLTAIEHLKKW